MEGVMANQEHLAILLQDVKTWNQWRDENPGIVPDLEFADLKGADLIGADLSRADLIGANLFRANLFRANLSLANLSRTNLFHANLFHANLFHANLFHANLANANLSRANLSRADLSRANLSRADLSNAKLTQTIFDTTQLKLTQFTQSTLFNTRFINVDLSQTVELEAIIFDPNYLSSIDLCSIYCSQGHIPKIFLKACNITDELRQALPELLGIPQEVQYVDVEVPKVEIQYVEVEVPKVEVQYVEVEVPKIEYKYVEVPVQQPTPTIDPQEIEFQKELLATLRSRNQELQKSKALFGLGHVPQHILLEIKEIRREIAERKAYLRGHNVAIADHYDD
jgi:hypothetical protein